MEDAEDHTPDASECSELRFLPSDGNAGSSRASDRPSGGTSQLALPLGTIRARREPARLWESPPIFVESVLRAVAAHLGREHTDDRIEDHPSLLGYCLLARHRETRLPFLAHLALRDAGECRGYYEAMHPAASLMNKEHFGCALKLVAEHVESNPGHVPATAFIVLVSLMSAPTAFRLCLPWVPAKKVLHASQADILRESLAEMWERCGVNLAPASVVNWQGESQLADVLVAHTAPWLLPFTHDDDDPRMIKSFMDHVPHAREVVNTKSPMNGDTPVHLAVKLDLPACVLKVLIAYGADISIKDCKGRTALALARIYQRGEDIVKLLTENENPTEELPPGAAKSLGPGPSIDGELPAHQLPRFPGIYLPSNPDLKSSQTNQILVEYLRSQLPQLLDMDPSLVVVPPVGNHDMYPNRERTGRADDYWEGMGPNQSCPYPDGSPEATGWKTEQKVLQTVVMALEAIHKDQPSLHIACFSNLRYGCHLTGHGQWESDFDIAVLCCDTSGGECGVLAVVLLEIKSITRAKDVIRKGKDQQTHALDQLCKHICTLEQYMNIEPSSDWVIPCLALPLYPTTRGQNGRTEEEKKLRTEWDEYLNGAEKISGNVRMAGHAKIKPKLLTRSELEAHEELKLFFRGIFKSTSNRWVALDQDSKDKRKSQYSTILAWCVAHCMGIAVPCLSQTMDNQSKIFVEEKLALLTLAQKRVYELPPRVNSSPLLIVGAAGTGKTLLAVQKLIKCEKDGLINQRKLGIFLTHKHNEALIALVKKQLENSSTHHISVKPVDEGSLKSVLMSMKHAMSSPRFSFVVLDQLEDMLALPSDETDTMLLPLIMKMHWFELFWITINPLDERVFKRPKPCVSAYLSNQENSAQCVFLDARIRNTTKIGDAVDRFNDSCLLADASFTSALRRFRPEPASWAPSLFHQGIPIFSKVYDLYHDLSVLPKVLHHLLLSSSVRDKHIVVITLRVDPGRIPELDGNLIKEFCKTSEKKKMPSMAPLLVAAAWVGEVKDYLDDAELDKVRTWFRESASAMPVWEPAAHTESHALLQRFRKCVQDAPSTDSHREQELHKSVAFQASLSLVHRFVTFYESNENKERGVRHLQELDQVFGTDAGPHQLRDLILKHRCISILDQKKVGGYEADVAVVWLDHSVAWSSPRHDGRLSGALARAKVMTVVLASYLLGDELKKFIPTMKPLFDDK